jgi:putative MATE family efflux protein
MWMIPVGANIVLCWLFILVLHMGVSGAALATVLGQTISAGMSIYFFFFKKNRSYKIKAAYFKPDWSIIAEIIIIGFPSFVKSISASIVVIVTNNLLRLIGGDSALSVFAIVNRLYSGLSMPQTGIMQGMQPILGYNFGQKRFSRVWKTITYSLGTAVVYGLIVCGLCVLIPATLIALLSKEPVIIAEGQVALRLMSLACPLGGISLMVAAYFQAVGRAKEALLITLGGIIFVKLPVLLLASTIFSLTGIWSAEAVSELTLSIISLLMLRRYQGKIATMEHLAYSG